MKIYVATSWRNEYYPDVIKRLRKEGHDVYDFRNLPTWRAFFSWSDIDTEWESWSTTQFRDALSTPIARADFHSDMGALRSCDALLLVLPCGASAQTELGWATGARKITIIYDPTGKPNAELMYLMCDAIVDDIDHAVAILERERRFIA
jgi:hypothetical protein